jgi:hypothetical protein
MEELGELLPRLLGFVLRSIPTHAIPVECGVYLAALSALILTRICHGY